jgi:hypothetical protein
MNMTTDNALHAAETWLERVNADPAAVAVVNVQPTAGLGVWQPGSTSVVMLPRIDDAGAELCEATAPVVQEVLERLSDDDRTAAMAGIGAGARLQALLAPAAGEISIRLIHGSQCFTLAALVRDGLAH